VAHPRAVGPPRPSEARPGRCPGDDGARRPGDARLHCIRRPPRDREAQAPRNRRGRGRKRAGARAVGIAGGPEKCAYVKDKIGFDAAVDHKGADFTAKLAAACPDGIDVYFENVGGAVWQAVLPLLNNFARVPVSGLVAQYNAAGPGDGADRLPATMRAILSKSLTVRGFINYDFAAEHYPAFLGEVRAGIADGRIRYREDFVDGLEKAPEAFIGMLDGRNFGKLIVRVDGGSKQ
jgi:NADPH-dependent curcumin reductase CurA